MNKSTNTYNVDGLEIQVTSYQDWVEAKTMKADSNFQIKMAPGAEIPFSGRFHCSIAAAEPVIPHHIYTAMLSAVGQHNKKTSTSEARRQQAASSEA